MAEKQKSIDPERYYKESEIYDRLKSAGINIRFTHSLDALTRQHKEFWQKYVDALQKEATKYGNEPDMALAKKHYIRDEIELFTGFLETSDRANDKIEIEKHLNNLRWELTGLDNTKVKAAKYETLIAAFIEPEKYLWIINRLVSTNFCEAGTLRWLTDKEIMVGFLKDLYRKAYLYRPLTHREMRAISENDFGLTLGERVCSINPDIVDIPKIPPASAIQ